MKVKNFYPSKIREFRRTHKMTIRSLASAVGSSFSSVYRLEMHSESLEPTDKLYQVYTSIISYFSKKNTTAVTNSFCSEGLNKKPSSEKVLASSKKDSSENVLTDHISEKNTLMVEFSTSDLQTLSSFLDTKIVSLKLDLGNLLKNMEDIFDK